MRYALIRISRFVLVFVIVTFLVMCVTRIGSKDPVRDLAGGQVAFLEHFEDAAAGRIAERLEEEVQWIYN